MKRALWIIFLFLPISSWSEMPNHHLAKTSQSSNAEGQDAYQAKDYSHLLGKVEGMIAIGKQGSKKTLPEGLQKRESPSNRKLLEELTSEGVFSF